MQERKLELSLDRLSFSLLLVPFTTSLFSQGRVVVSRRQLEQEEHMQERKLELSLDRLDAKLAVFFIFELLYINCTVTPVRV